MNKKLGVFVATIVMAVTVYGVAWAECTIAPNTRHYSTAMSDKKVGQSWTAPCTETLDSVAFYSSTQNVFTTLSDVTLSIYQGLPNSGTLLTSQTVTLTKGALMSIKITQDVTIQEGVQYSFLLTHASQQIALSVGNEAYSGGLALLGNSSIDYYDLFFSVKLGRTASAPTVTTTAVSSIGTTSAVSGGNVTDEGSALVTGKGVCWNTSGTPVMADNYTDEGQGAGVFTSNLSGLTPNTTYYVRAYAINSVDTSYGAEETFTTSALPTAIPLTGGLGLAAFGAALASLAWRRARTSRKH